MGFKHFKPGMSLLEVVVAITVLAFFATSLFMIQQYLYNRMMITKIKVVADLRLEQVIAEYEKQIMEEQLQNNGVVDKSLSSIKKDFQDPFMQVTVAVHQNIVGKSVEKEQEGLFKHYKNLYILSAHAFDQSRQYAALYKFLYIPKVTKNE